MTKVVSGQSTNTTEPIDRALDFLRTLRIPHNSPSIEPVGRGSDVYRFSFLSPEACDEIVSLFSKFSFQRSQLAKGNAGDYRTSEDVFFEHVDPRLHAAFSEYALSVLCPVTRQIWRWDCDTVSDVTLVRYSHGAYYKEHIDAADERFCARRQVSVIVYLSDQFDGGETYFRRQSLTVTPVKSDAIVFPAGITHPHEALPVRNGSKQIIAAWLSSR